MNIELKSIKIADLINGYSNDPDTGVKGYDGKLDIRPPYQREFRYDVKQQQAVVDTILKGFPLNIMYWSVGEDGNYEMIDGQQRTLSICEFRTHGFNIEDPDRGTLYFSTLTKDEQKNLIGLELSISPERNFSIRSCSMPFIPARLFPMPAVTSPRTGALHTNSVRII